MNITDNPYRLCEASKSVKMAIYKLFDIVGCFRPNIAEPINRFEQDWHLPDSLTSAQCERIRFTFSHRAIPAIARVFLEQVGLRN